MLKINWNPSSGQLRQFAALWFPALAAGLGALVVHRTHAWSAGCWVWLPAIAVSAVCWFSRPAARIVFLCCTLAVYPIGWVVSHAILAAVFYLLLTPIGLMSRWLGHDPLKKQFDRTAKTYWVPHEPPKDASRYFRQF